MPTLKLHQDLGCDDTPGRRGTGGRPAQTTLRDVIVKHWPTRHEQHSVNAMGACALMLHVNHNLTHEETWLVFQDYLGAQITFDDFENMLYRTSLSFYCNEE